MEGLKRKKEKSWAYLDKWLKEARTKAYFSEWPKMDNICTNAYEVFNGKIAQFKRKPLLTLAEEVRRHIVKTTTK